VLQSAPVLNRQDEPTAQLLDEKRLCAAVLLKTVRDLTGADIVHGRNERLRLKRYARMWFELSRGKPGS
jgi:hypothetical protein